MKDDGSEVEKLKMNEEGLEMEKIKKKVTIDIPKSFRYHLEDFDIKINKGKKLEKISIQGIIFLN